MQDRQFERRTRQRFSMQLPLVLSSSGSSQQWSGITQDVSSGGILFHLDSKSAGAPAAESTAIEFILAIPPEITLVGPIRLCCKGRIVRKHATADGKLALVAVIDSYTWG